MDIEHSDKENIGPTAAASISKQEIRYPVLPSIFTYTDTKQHSPIYLRKSPAKDRNNPNRASIYKSPIKESSSILRTPSNISRKRQRLSTTLAKNSPPRPSYASQVSSIFASSVPPKVPSHRHAPARSFAVDENSHEPSNELERAITSSLPITPTRRERRKAIHVALSPKTTAFPSTARPQPSPGSSTGDWTGDEVFYHPIYARRQPHSPPSPLQGDSDQLPPPSPQPPPQDRQPAPPATSRVKGEPIPPPPRAMVQSSRFMHLPAARSPIGSGEIAGVPLCMEEHPASLGSDADDEDEYEGDDGA